MIDVKERARIAGLNQADRMSEIQAQVDRIAAATTAGTFDRATTDDALEVLSALLAKVPDKSETESKPNPLTAPFTSSPPTQPVASINPQA